MPFTVTRQKRWSDGLSVVEITEGDLDYANPDALSPRYPGEMETYPSLTEAVEQAIRIAHLWQADTKDKVHLALGNTHGFTAELDAMPLDADTESYLRKRAREADATLPRCDRCGTVLDVDNYWFDDAGNKYCTSVCVEEAERELFELLTEEESP